MCNNRPHMRPFPCPTCFSPAAFIVLPIVSARVRPIKRPGGREPGTRKTTTFGFLFVRFSCERTRRIPTPRPLSFALVHASCCDCLWLQLASPCQSDRPSPRMSTG
ncbi:unnamed protein product [Ectocarpus sp. 8 AP-2014]